MSTKEESRRQKKAADSGEPAAVGLALHFVDGVASGVFVGFHHGFRKRRVRVDGFGHEVHGGFESKRGDGGGDHVRYVRADHVDAQDFAVLLLGDDLDEAVLLGDGHGLTEDSEVGLADDDIVALGLGFALGEADAGDFGDGIDAVRDGLVVHLLALALDDIGDRSDAFGRRDVGELDSTGDVTDGVDVGDAGDEGVVHDLDASAVKLHADLFEVHVVGVGLSTDAEEDDFDFENFGVSALLDVALPAALGLLDLFEGSAGADLDALATEELAEFDAEVTVHHGDEVGHHLDDGDIGTESVENVSELYTDGAAAEDEHGLGNSIGGDGLVRGPDAFLSTALKSGDGDVDDGGAHGENEVLRADLLFLAVLAGDFDGVGIDEGGKSLDVADAVLFEEHADAASLRENDLIFALHEGIEVDGGFAFDLYAQRGCVLDVIQSLDAGNHDFRGDTAPVQTCSA